MSKKAAAPLAALIRLQLVNLLDINVYRSLKDPKEKRKKSLLYAAYAAVAAVAAVYAGGMSYGYVLMGLGNILPAYLILLASVIILMFSIFKAGDILFQRNEMLTSLPVRSSEIVISRFVRLYVENLLLSLLVMLPAMAVFGALQKPDWTFYGIGLISVFFIPLFPITISVFFGALIKAAAARSRHKNLISTVLTIVLMVALVGGGTLLAPAAENMDIHQAASLLSAAFSAIRGVYPPAVWLGEAMLTGDFGVCLGCVLAALAVLSAVICVLSRHYAWICDGIFSTGARHDYRMQRLRSTNALGALYRREFRRYFASSVYVTNTLVSPVMGLLLAGALLFISPEQINQMAAELQAQTGAALNIRSALPVAIAAVLCLMPVTAVSISMEGKQWWIIKTLPLSAGTVLDSKLLMNLTLLAPCCVICAVMAAVGQKADPAFFAWLLLVPLCAVTFACVFGQTVNLKLAVFDWENEVSVVKQSASAFVGGILPALVMVVTAFGAMLIPEKYTDPAMLALCVLFGSAAFVLYRKNRRVDLVNV